MRLLFWKGSKGIPAKGIGKSTLAQKLAKSWLNGVRKRGLLEKGSFLRKGHFLELLENLDPPDSESKTLENKGDFDHPLEILEKFREFRDILEIPPVNIPLS